MKRFTFLNFTIVIIINLIYKIIYIDFRDIALDEPFSIFVAQQDFNSILKITLSGNSLPLFEILLHFFIKLFGIGAFAMRLPSVVFSSVAAGVVFSIGNKFINKSVGVISALLFSLSTMHMFFAHEARVYPLFVMLTAISLYYFLSILTNQKFKNYLGLFVANVLLIYAHYFGWFVLLTEFFCFFFYFENKKGYLKSISLFVVGILVFYTPIIKIFYERAMYSAAAGTWVEPPKITELYGNINRFLNDRIVTAALAIVILIGFIFAYNKGSEHIKVLLRNTLSKNNKILITFFGLSYLLMFVLSYKVPMFIDRYILFTSIPLYLCIAVVINSINNKTKIYYTLLTLLFLVQLVFFNLKPDNNRRIKEVAENVKALKQNPETKVYLAPHYADLSFAYHYNQDIFKDYTNFKQRLESENIYGLESAEVLEREPNPSTQHIIFVECGSEFIDPNHNILKYFTSHYNLKSEKHIFEIYTVYEFVKK